MRAIVGPVTTGEGARPNADADADDLRLVAEVLRRDRDLERSLLLFRRDQLWREARIRIPACAELPRFISCTNWDHRFPQAVRDAKTRWVFDRRLWSVVVLQLQGAGGAWLEGAPNELLDVTESLVFANSDALHDVRNWGCVEGLTLPRWTAEASVVRHDPPDGRPTALHAPAADL